MGAIPVSGQLHNDFHKIGKRQINKGRFGYPNLLNSTQELEQGSALDRDIRKKLRISHRRDMADYLQQIVEIIAAKSDFKGKVTVRLSSNQDDMIFTTMGGYVYVDEDLLRAVGKESELAGALAHEIGHLAARHGSENVTRDALVRHGNSRMYHLIEQSLTIPRNLGIRNEDEFWLAVRYGNEIEADELGTQYLWNSGFDPNGLASFLQRVKDNNLLDMTKGAWRSMSQPPFDLRLNRIGKVLKKLPILPSARVNSSSFIEFQAQLRRASVALRHKSGQN